MKDTKKKDAITVVTRPTLVRNQSGDLVATNGLKKILAKGKEHGISFQAVIAGDLHGSIKIPFFNFTAGAKVIWDPLAKPQMIDLCLSVGAGTDYGFALPKVTALPLPSGLVNLDFTVAYVKKFSFDIENFDFNGVDDILYLSVSSKVGVTLSVAEVDIVPLAILYDVKNKKLEIMGALKIGADFGIDMGQFVVSLGGVDVAILGGVLLKIKIDVATASKKLKVRK